jgi:hypothetical protein
LCFCGYGSRPVAVFRVCGYFLDSEKFWAAHLCRVEGGFRRRGARARCSEAGQAGAAQSYSR